MDELQATVSSLLTCSKRYADRARKVDEILEDRMRDGVRENRRETDLNKAQGDYALSLTQPALKIEYFLPPGRTKFVMATQNNVLIRPLIESSMRFNQTTGATR
jgi:hypothetical protein